MDPRVFVNHGIWHGKPVLRGTRMPVACILRGRADGMNIGNIQQEHGLAWEDICAAPRFAGEQIQQDEHDLLPK